MKKLLLFPLLLLASILAGCNTTTATYTNGPVTMKVSNMREAWSTDSYDWQFSTNGVFHATATKSGPDATTVQAFANIVGAAIATKP